MTPEEIAGITNINVPMEDIKSLQGIELFTALTSLDCRNNPITELDVSGLTALASLNCGGCDLYELDVSGCTALENLICNHNYLTSLDVNDCIKLTSLNCNQNYLASLNVSDCIKLTTLDCKGNALKELNVSNFKALSGLRCHGNELEKLHVSGYTSLTVLYCNNNKLRSLDLSGNSMFSLVCDNQNISIEMKGANSRYTALEAFDDNVTFGNAALSYDATKGLLISSDDTVTSSTFSSPTSSIRDLTGTLTLTYSYKTAIDITGVSVENKTYDGLPITYIGTPANTEGYTGSYEFEWSSGSAPINAGTYQLTVRIPDSDETLTGELVNPFTIEKATITITSKNKSAYVRDPLPVLSASDYILTGIAAGETLSTEPTLTYSDVPDMTRPGTYTINASGAVVHDSDNYNSDITYISGTLTIRRRLSGGSGTGGGSYDSRDSDSVKSNLPLTTEEILKELEREEISGIRLELKMPEQGVDIDQAEKEFVLYAEVIKKAKEYRKDIIVEVKDSDDKVMYVWTFDDVELSNSDKDIHDVNLLLKVNKAPEDTNYLGE